MSPNGGPAALEMWRSLGSRDARDRLRLHVVEGARFVFTALRTRAPVRRAIVAPELLSRASREAAARLRNAGVGMDFVGAAEYARASSVAQPSGVAAIVEQRWSPLGRPARRQRAVWVAFGRVRSPGNLGTTLRTARAAGAAGALFLDPTADPFDPVAVRASMGACLELPLTRTNPGHVARWKRRCHVHVAGSSAHATRDYQRLPHRGPLVVMLGCERRGMSREQRRLCDSVVRIPMAPGAASVNLGVAAGVLLFAARAAAER